MSHIGQVLSAHTPWSCGISFPHDIVLKNDIREVRTLEYHSGMTLKRSNDFQSRHHFETSKIVQISTISPPIYSKKVACTLFSLCFPEQGDTNNS